MCGLVGLAGKLVYQDEFIMKRLLLADFFRGEHSTGMAAVRASGEAIIAKIASNPIDLFGLKQFQDALNGNMSRVFLGHNRAATRGKVTTVNAHPYRFDHIVGAHNGTLDYESVRALETALDEKFDVDSMALIAGIARLGIKETIKLCNEGKDNKDGAWAIVWYDQNEGSLNFLRNKHRPLWYAFEEGFKRMIWASEWWMIREAIAGSPNDYPLYTENEKDSKNVGYFTFDEDVHYKFDIAALCEGSKKRPKPVCKPIKGKVKEEVGYSTNGNFSQLEWPRSTNQGTPGTHIGAVGSPNSRQKTDSGSTTSHRGTLKDRKRQVIQLFGEEKPYAGVVTEDSFTLQYNNCSFCGVGVKYGDTGLTIFERDGRVLCRSCTGYPDHIEAPPSRIYIRSPLFDAMA